MKTFGNYTDYPKIGETLSTEDVSTDIRDLLLPQILELPTLTVTVLTMMVMTTIQKSKSQVKKVAEEVGKLKQYFLRKGLVAGILLISEVETFIEKNMFQDSVQTKIDNYFNQRNK